MVVKIIQKYLRVLFAFLNFQLKYALEYRVNFLLQAFYGPAYVAILFSILQVAYNHTETIAGWSKPETMVIFCIFHFLYTIGATFFMKGIRNLLWNDVRLGNIDMMLTKPVNFQFLVTFRDPSFNQILLMISLLPLFFYEISKHPEIITHSPVDIFWFVFTMLTGIAIFYFAVSTYATSAFFFSKANQVIELFDKISDYSQYPLPLFPESLQLLLVTVVPVAFFSYVPALFLLGRGSIFWALGSLVFLCVLILVNQFCWKYALRQYSSASS